MKRIIILLVALLSTIVAMGQSQKRGAVYLALQPFDLGLGVRVDYYVNGVGLYNSLTYGNWALYRDAGLVDHYKITMGVLIPLKDYKGYQYDITGGINYHIIGDTKVGKIVPDSRVYDDWSFELGVTMKLPKFGIGLRTDILRWEPCVDLTWILFRSHNR